MAKIRKLKDLHLVGGVCDVQIYPETSTSAVYSRDKDDNPIEGVADILEDRLEDIEGKLTELSERGECECKALTDEEVKEILGEGGTSDDDSNGSCDECDCQSLTASEIGNILNA